MQKIKEFIVKIWQWTKSHTLLLGCLVNIILLAINIFFLLHRLQISVSMEQSQSQSTFTSVHNVNNNQNMNLNIMFGAQYHGTKIGTIATHVPKDQIINFVKTLAYYQQMGLTLISTTSNYIAIYPSVVTNLPQIPTSYTNYSTNYNVNKSESKSIWELLK